MKIAVVGGAGVRTPLLVNGLVRSDLPIRDLALYDIDQDRLRVIAGLASRFAGPASLTECATAAECVEGADYVFLSIRVGGIEGRARDESVSLAHGVVGQETVGPGGFAMAMRTIPPLVAYCREIERRAPAAWVINFTNPVGIITQAATTATGARVIGICDTPMELRRRWRTRSTCPRPSATDYFAEPPADPRGPAPRRAAAARGCGAADRSRALPRAAVRNRKVPAVSPLPPKSSTTTTGPTVRSRTSGGRARAGAR
jgi:alpha-galactosidase/6-phospho-beta-glucosidase family protein